MGLSIDILLLIITVGSYYFFEAYILNFFSKFHFTLGKKIDVLRNEYLNGFVNLILINNSLAIEIISLVSIKFELSL